MKLIELINATNQVTIASLSRLNLGNIDKSINQCAFYYNGIDTITLKQNGYYLVQVKADLTSTVANQSMSISLVGNGSTSQVAESTTFAAAVGTTMTTSFFKIVKVCGTSLSINIINSGESPTSVDNLIVSVEKIA